MWVHYFFAESFLFDLICFNVLPVFLAHFKEMIYSCERFEVRSSVPSLIQDTFTRSGTIAIQGVMIGNENESFLNRKFENLHTNFFRTGNQSWKTGTSLLYSTRISYVLQRVKRHNIRGFSTPYWKPNGLLLPYIRDLK